MSGTAAPARSFAFSGREALIAVIGGLALSGGLVALLRPDTAIDANPRSAPEQATIAPQFAVVPAASVVGTVSAPPAASAQGLVLYGISGGAGDRATAIIGGAGGPQRLIRIGREAAPGVVLKSVDRSGALLDEGGRLVRLVLVDASGHSALAVVAAAEGSADTDGGPYRRRDARTETMEFRLALLPRTEGGRVTGFVLRPGVDVPPLFQKAGLRPGDVIYLLNGRGFDSDRQIEGLSREIALSSMIRLAYERNGKLLEARVKIETQVM